MSDALSVLSEIAQGLSISGVDTVGSQKRAQLAATAAEKKNRLSKADNYTLAAGRAGNTGNNLTGVAKDLQTLNAIDLYKKYGDEGIGMNTDRGIADAEFMQDRSSYRSTGGAVADAAVGVGSGLVNTGFGITSLAAGLISDRAGQYVSEANSRFNADVQANQSDGLNARRRANASLDQLDQMDNDAQYAADKSTGHDVIAEFSRFGRGVANTVSRQIDDGMLLSDGISNAAGSLAGSGVLMKGLAKIGTAVLGKASAAGAVSTSTADKLTKAGTFMNAPIAVGSMEAGGAYQQTMNEAMDLLKDRTDLREEQKLTMAGDAAMKAAGLQGAAGAITGKLVGGFEKNILANRSLGQMAGNAFKETLEEGTQSFTGTLAQNEALSDQIDPGRDVGSGAGEQAGIGGLYGFGSTAVAQGPQATAKLAAKATVGAINKVYTSIRGRGANTIAKANSNSAVLSSIDTARANLTENLSTVTQEVQAAVDQDTSLDPDQKTAAQGFVSRLVGFLAYDPATAETQNEILRQGLEGSKNKIEAMDRAGKIAGNENADVAVRVAAGQYLLDVLQQHRAFASEDPGEAVITAAQNNGTKASFDAIENVLGTFVQDPRIRATIEAALEMQNVATVESVQDIATPEAQEGMASTIAVAQAAMLPGAKPETIARVNPEVIGVILQHASSGTINLTPLQKSSLVFAKALAETEQMQIAEGQRDGVGKIGVVSRNVYEDFGPQTSGRISLSQHMVDIMSSINGGNIPEARENLRDLMNFAQSYSNKIAALNRSREENGAAIPFEAWNQGEKTPFTQKGARWVAGNVNSERFVKQAASDARSVVRMANTISNAYPELGMEPIAMPELFGSATAVGTPTAPESAPGFELTAQQEDSTKPQEEPKADQAPVDANQLELDIQPVSPARQAVIDEVVHDTVDEADQEILADHYSEPEYNAKAKSRFVADVIAAINNGIESVAEAIRGIVQKAMIAVLAAAIVFQPAALQPAEAVKPQVVNTTEMVAIRDAVPMDARSGMSKQARAVYEVMANVAKASGKGFIIADKPNGKIHAFNKNGGFIASSNALYGKASGDVLTADSMAKTTAQMSDSDRVTPAGTFRASVINVAEYSGGKGLFLTDTKTGKALGGVAIHSVYLGEVSDKRLERLTSDNLADRKISYGCINTAQDFFLEKIAPVSAQFDGGMVFILPDVVENTAKIFPDQQKAVTRAVEIPNAPSAPNPLGSNVEGLPVDNRRRTPAVDGKAAVEGGKSPNQPTKVVAPEPVAAKPAERVAELISAVVAPPAAAKVNPKVETKVEPKPKPVAPVVVEAPKPVVVPAPVVEPVKAPVAERVIEPAKVEAPVAPVEVAAEAAPVSAPVSVVSKLLGDATNLLKSAFGKPSLEVSRLVGEENIARRMLEVMSSVEALKAFTNNENIANRLTDEAIAAYKLLLSRGVMGEVQAEMNKRLVVALTGMRGNGTIRKDGSVADYILKNIPIHRFVETRALNIVEQTDKGMAYNRQLQQSAILAGIQWIILAKERAIPMDTEALAKILNVEEDEIDQVLLDTFNDGIYLADGIRDLGQMITEFWGVKSKSTSPMGHTIGLPGGVSSEVMHGLIEAGMMKMTPVEFNGKTYNIVKLFPSELAEGFPDDTFNEMMKGLKAFPNAIELTVLPEADELVYIGKPPTKVPLTQLRNKAAALTAQQKSVISRVQKIAYNLNMPLVNVIGTMEPMFVRSLFAYGELDKNAMNSEDHKAKKSVNDSLNSALESIGGLILQVQNQAKVDGVADDKIKIFYDYVFTRVNRLQMKGRNNPQANKLVRELVTSVKSTMDLSNDNSPETELFWLGIAQAWDIKIHKMSRELAIEKARELAKGKYAGTLAMMQKHMAKAQKDDTLRFTREQIDLIQSEMAENGEPMTVAAFNSMVELARFENATANERKAFETSVYVEADGVTDGPINAMIHLASGLFSADLLELLERGGAFITGKSMSMNEKTDKADTYEVTKDNLQKIIQTIKSARTVEEPGDFPAIERLLARLAAGIKLNENNELVFDRKVTKNPLTVTIYGAGKTGLANKIANEMLSSMYGIMTDLANNDVSKFVDQADYDQFIKDFQQITGRNISTNFKTQKLTKFEFKRLSGALADSFVEPMQEAIEQTIGETMIARTALRKAIQVQSIVMQAAFNAEIQKALIEKKNTAAETGWQAGDFLSKSELDAIFEKLMALNPVISTGNQNIFMGSSERVNSTNSRFSRSLTDKLEMPSFVYAPEDAGVSGIPGFVISVGDGQMIQYIVMDPNNPSQALYIYDGVNLPLSTLEADSLVINKAVHKGWMDNPYAALAQAFDVFINVADLSSIPEEQLKLLGKALSNKGDKPVKGITNIRNAIFELNDEVQELAVEIQARKNVLAQVNMSVDHMASAGKPYVMSTGVELGELSFQEKADAMNVMWRDEMAKLKAARGEARKAAPPKYAPKQSLVAPVAPKTVKPQVAAPAPVAIPVAAPVAPVKEASNDITNYLASMGTEMKSMGVRIIDSSALLSIVKNLNIPGNQKNIMKPLLAALTGKGVKIVHGKLEDIREYASRMNEPGARTLGADTHGFFSTGTNTIYLVAASSETLVHELIHAATYAIVAAYFSNPESLTADQRDAVKRLDALYTEWSGTEYFLDEVTDAAYSAFENALAAANDQEQSGNRAAAINEMMAWVLANQDLARVATKVTVKTLLGRVAVRALEALKALWSDRKAPEVGEDFYSNLRFNTEILLRTPSVAMPSDVILQQSVAFGSSDRLTQVRKGFYERIMASDAAATEIALKRMTPRERIIYNNSVQVPLARNRAVSKAEAVTQSFEQHGFPMTPQERGTFQVMLTAFMTETELDPSALIRIEELYRTVVKQLDVRDFMSDPLSLDTSIRTPAQEKYDSVMGNFITSIDDQGRSSLMPAFMALATVNEGFRDILMKMDLPKSDLINGDSFDARLTNMGTKTMDYLAKMMSSEGKQPNILGALNRMTDQIAQVGQWEKSFLDHAEKVMRPGDRLVDMANDVVVNAFQTGSRKVFIAATKLRNTSSNKAVRMGADFVGVIAAMVNIEDSKQISIRVTSAMDTMKGFTPFRELVSEMIGRTEENSDVYDLIKIIRSTVKAMRQQFREKLPKIVAQQFSRKITDEEWTQLHNSLGVTDIAALLGGFTMSDVMSMIKNRTEMARNIRSIEQRLGTIYGRDFPELQRKGKELAKFMNTREVSEDMVTNAYALSRLWGLTGNTKYENVANSVVKDIDSLVSLYALDTMAATDKAALESLVQAEPKGVEFVISYLVGQRAEEQAKLVEPKARDNHYKGFIPSPANAGKTLVVRNTADEPSLLVMGYTRVANYVPSGAERSADAKAYYYAPLATRAAFHEGITQTVRQTASGVDPVTGYTVDYLTAGRIINPKTVREIIRLRQRGVTGGEALMPIYSAGKIVAFERSIDAVQDKLLERNTNLSEILGIWRGRQVEESMAVSVNETLVDKLYANWEAAKVEGLTAEYVNVFDDASLKDDPVLKDAVNLIPGSMRQYIVDVYGTNEFWIRKSMINNTLGYRGASLGDAWTGTTRWSEDTQKQVREIVTGVFGKDAYKYVVRGERIVQAVVSDAKVTIVVKSVIVPTVNLMANVLQLVSRGVPIVDIARGIPRKTGEIDLYVRSRIKKMDLEAQLRTATNNPNLTIKLKTEIQSIDDSWKRLSIWPLLEAGEFAAISDVGIGQDEIDLVEGRLSTYMEKYASNLPDSVKTIGKYAIVAKDTALYQGLQRAMEYGDFLGKAILYDHLTKTKAMTKAEAMAVITEEYVNYDYLPGRTRSYADTMGLAWFWSFKLRSAKVAMSMMRHNPFHTLLASLAPMPDMFGTVGSPLTDNIWTVGLDGRLDNSLGWGMGFRSHSLNPWWQIIG